MEEATRNPVRGSLKAYLMVAGSFLGGLLVAFLLSAKTELPREAVFMGGIFALACLLWVTEALPLFATSLLVIALQMILLANPGGWIGLGFEAGESPGYRDILKVAADPVMLLFFGGFLLARAAVKERVDRVLSLLFLQPFKGSPALMLFGIMLVTAVFSMWMSNTATTAMMMALISPIVLQLPEESPFRTGLTLSVPFAANIGSVGTPIASPPNAVAVGFLSKEGFSVGFLKWMLVGIPLLILVMGFCWMLLWFYFKPREGEVKITLAAEKLAPRGVIVVVTFTVTVLLWLTGSWHGLPSPVVAILPAVVLTATGVLNREDLQKLDWHVLILIAGGISLGSGIQMTGLDRFITGFLPGGDEGGSKLLIPLLGMTLVMSTFMSNTASANLLIPIGVAGALASGAGGIHPVAMAVSIAMVASLSMALPISTPPNAIAFASGAIKTRDMVKVGGLVGIFGLILVSLFGGPLMRLMGLLN